MKTPTLEEVKEYFKDAETIECLGTGKEVIYLNNPIFGKYVTMDIFEYDRGFAKSTLFTTTEGYAKILTYKEKPKPPIY